MANYTLTEIKEELFREIEELEKIDSSYLSCRKCPRHGKCCIGNDIDIREDEWDEIKSFLDKNTETRETIKENLKNHSKCYFRTEECCLIHDIRPTNCIYTPYQMIQNLYDFTLTYSLKSHECDFETVSISSNPLDTDTYIKKDEKTGHYYLFLNYWFLKFENQSENGYKMTGEERLKEYFGMN